MVAEMLQKWKFIWYKNIFSFNQNNFVFNKTYFHYITFFSWYQNIFSFNQNKFVFNKIYFHYITFFHDTKINFHSTKINFYSVRNIFIIYIFFIQVKYIFIIWIFHWMLFCWAYLVFSLYLQKSEFYFQCVNWTTAQVREY